MQDETHTSLPIVCKFRTTLAAEVEPAVYLIEAKLATTFVKDECYQFVR